MPAILIAGAGPAGLSVAIKTASAGLETIVVERNAAIGIPLRTSGGSWIDELGALGVPERFYVPMRRIRVIGPIVEAVFDYRQPMMCVLDVRAFYQWLAERAVAAGAQIRLETRVVDLIRSHGRATGMRVRLPSGAHTDIDARVVVDATGHPSALARRDGLHAGFEQFGVGVEWDLYAPDFDQHEALLIVGDRLAPNGYAWAFPYGHGRIRLGVGIARPHSGENPHAYLDAICDRVPALAPLKRASPIESHLGLIPLAPPKTIPLVRDGLVVVGDAAGQASALVGEGIRYVMHAGRAAGDAIVAACAAGGTSDAALERYPRAWGRRERNLRFAWEIFRRIIVFHDADWDREIDQLNRLTPEQFGQGLKGDFTLGWLMAVVPRYTGMLVPGRFRDGIRRFVGVSRTSTAD